MSLNQKQFEVLTFIQNSHHKKITQRSLASCVKMSLGMVNQVLNECMEQEWLCKIDGMYHITSEGYQQLYPYRVKRAIILADQFNKKFLPLAAKQPIMLSRIHGKVIIEVLIEALLTIGIDEIFIVRGYLGEQFDYLQDKYEGITLKDNPHALETGSIMSLYTVKEYIENAYVIDENFLLYDANMLRLYEYAPSVGGMLVDWTDDVCFRSRKGIVTAMNCGGRNVYQKAGITYFDQQSAKQMLEDIQVILQMPGGKQKNYLDICFQDFPLRYQFHMKYIAEESILRFSSYKGLEKLLDEI